MQATVPRTSVCGLRVQSRGAQRPSKRARSVSKRTCCPAQRSEDPARRAEPPGRSHRPSVSASWSQVCRAKVQVSGHRLRARSLKMPAECAQCRGKWTEAQLRAKVQVNRHRAQSMSLGRKSPEPCPEAVGVKAKSLGPGFHSFAAASS